MSDAIRCEACRWFRNRDPYGRCELNPPVHIGYPMDCETMEWQQPIVFEGNGCSRGEPKTTPIPDDSDPVAMVDGLPVFRPKLTEDKP